MFKPKVHVFVYMNTCIDLDAFIIDLKSQMKLK